MKGLPAETDFVVLGAGVAGLRAAIELSAAGRVLVLAKGEAAGAAAPEKKTAHAGPPALLSDEDEIRLHLQDTLAAGDGLCNPDAVKALMEEAPDRAAEVIAWGTPSSKSAAKLVFSTEGPHGHERVLHAQGESASAEVARILQTSASALKNISFAPFSFTTGLLMDGGRVCGVSLLDDKGVPQEIACSAVLLATGGCGQLYRTTTNSAVATADGLALAARAGAEISDMEFVQFCPTALYAKKAPRLLLSDALCADGGHLRNFEMNRFMGKYHPAGELAPRDLVARAIVHEMEVSRARDPFVYLDFTYLNAGKVQKRFPRIYAACMEHNIDITEDMIPVRPAAHFAAGGVRTNLDGKTTLAGLYAAGELAASGVHGANRFPGNSLLEALVFGARAGRAMQNERRPVSGTGAEPKAAYSNGPVDAGVEELIGQIQDLMWSEVGIVRTRVGMQKAVKTLEEMAAKVAHPKTRRRHEAANLHLAALLTARSALAREESRGAHYRMDYPGHDDRKFLKHSVVKSEGVRFV
jgi:L-aspartate oxidase